MKAITDVSVIPLANVYFDGKCVSHTLETDDGRRLSVGVILPSSLTFSTGAPETMELIAGRCRIHLAGNEDWQDYVGGESFDVPGDSSFDRCAPRRAKRRRVVPGRDEGALFSRSGEAG